MKSILLTIGLAAVPIQCQISTSLRKDLQTDILIVNTLDGFLHGINKTTGLLLWSKGLESGMVSVKHSTTKSPHSTAPENTEIKDINHYESDAEKVVFIPEPAADGDLYYIQPGKGLQKFNTTLKEIIANNLGTRDESFIYTGGKVTTVLALNPETGEIIKTIGGSKEPSECQESTRNAVFISRTQYKLDIYNVHTNQLLWNISYVEYSPTPSIASTASNENINSVQVKADVHGNFRLVNNGVDHFFKTEFSTPVVGVFDMVNDEYGTHLFKPIHSDRDVNSQGQAYVGNYDGTLYLLSDEHFPFIDKHTDVDDKDLTIEGITSLDIAQSSSLDPAQSTLVGTYTLDAPQTMLIEEMVEQSSFISTTLMYFFCCIVAVVVAVKYVNELFAKKAANLGQEADIQESSEKESLLEKKSGAGGMVVYDHLKSVEMKVMYDAKPEPSSPSSDSKNSSDTRNSGDSSDTLNNLPSTSPALKSLQVSEKVLGYGSHGTVVLEGKFEGRKVAIKRMLSDFYAVADQEVKMLQESDFHPNVVRYFFKEEAEGFMYIALEHCAGSIADLVANKDIPELIYIKKYMTIKEMFKQMLSGLEHLHSLNIVHRDIKPQNILISKSKKKPRMLISDFGLGKRLDDGQSSFHNTYVPGGGVAGTVGWRAPECLLAHHAAVKDSKEWNDHTGKSLINEREIATTRITKAIDIFSLGCVIYYVASDGSHPFGEQFSREINILKGNFRLKHFDKDDEDSLLKDMIKRMIVKDPSKRLTAEATLRHPYFWNTVQQLSFLQDLSDRLEIETKEPLSPLLKQLERLSTKVFGRDWTIKMNKTVLDSMSKYRKYNGNSLQDLLRALRNKKHHYQDLSLEAQQELGSLPVEFLNYFLSRYPNLLVSMVQYVTNNEVLTKDALLSHYFPE